MSGFIPLSNCVLKSVINWIFIVASCLLFVLHSTAIVNRHGHMTICSNLNLDSLWQNIRLNLRLHSQTDWQIIKVKIKYLDNLKSWIKIETVTRSTHHGCIIDADILLNCISITYRNKYLGVSFLKMIFIMSRRSKLYKALWQEKWIDDWFLKTIVIRAITSTSLHSGCMTN